MPERYKHPPLVELIAELRWSSGSVMATDRPKVTAMTLLAAGQYEEFFMRFGSNVGARGYDLVERIVPPGFPALPFQAIYRFRQKQQIHGTTLYQVGAGVFSANITPPYQSWEAFSPVVREGVSVLLETRNTAERQLPFSNASLRYINSFDRRFTQGSSTATFVRDVLGFRIEPPPAVLHEIAPHQEAKPFLQLAIPLASGPQMSLMLAEGTVSGKPSVIMDIAINVETPIQATEADVMGVFEAAHDVIHRVFVGTTKELSPMMELVEGEET